MVQGVRRRLGDQMKLLIISNMAHYQSAGQIVGWGPTVQEIDHLAQAFEEVRHIACLHPQQAPGSSLPYASERVSLIPVLPAGGRRFRDKLDILRLSPGYLSVIMKELIWADVVHVRCPANISLWAIVLLALVRTPRIRWVKYAGSWQPGGTRAWSYALQRWWLNKGLHRGVVTVNGRWPNQPKHVYSFLNPCLTDQEIAEARLAASEKQISIPPRLIYAGRLERAKGLDRLLNILARLQQRGLSVTLDLVGDGPERPAFENLARALGVAQLVKFHGWLPRPGLAPLYAQAHLMVLPSSSEGWPKVLSEAMAYGVVPISSNVGSIPEYLDSFGTGKTFDPDDVEGFTDAISYYSLHPEAWKKESEKGMRAAQLFTYANYLKSIQNLLDVNLNGEFETALANPIF